MTTATEMPSVVGFFYSYQCNFVYIVSRAPDSSAVNQTCTPALQFRGSEAKGAFPSTFISIIKHINKKSDVMSDCEKGVSSPQMDFTENKSHADPKPLRADMRRQATYCTTLKILSQLS